MARRKRHHKTRFNGAARPRTNKAASEALAEVNYYIRTNQLNRRKREPTRALQLMQNAARDLILFSHEWSNGEITEQDKDRVGILLVILGENTRHIDERVKKDHPEIPWKDLMGVRNFLTHNPHLADDKFWCHISEFVRKDLPKIKAETEKFSAILSRIQDVAWQP